MILRNNQRGSSLVELIMVMTLLVLFGVIAYTLIFSGSKTQERMEKEKESQTDARIALSYVNVRLRQNDSNGKITVEKAELTGKDAIVIKERDSLVDYDTWIYCYNGIIYECLVDPGEQPAEDGSFYIADSAGMETTMDHDKGSITNTVYYLYGDSLKSISSTFHIRSN